MVGWINGLMNGWKDGWTCKFKHYEWMNGWMHEWMDIRWMNGLMQGELDRGKDGGMEAHKQKRKDRQTQR